MPPFRWPDESLACPPASFSEFFNSRELAETRAMVAANSRWPTFFPSPIAFVTAGQGSDAVVERVVGPMIVNRFPLIAAFSLCREHLSTRHYARRRMMAAIEQAGAAALQFLAPGPALKSALGAVAALPDSRAHQRLCALDTRLLARTDTTALESAYLVYEGRLARPGSSRDERHVFDQPWTDIGSHRLYFMDVEAIHLSAAIARGQRQVAWQSLPGWTPALAVPSPPFEPERLAGRSYVKTYTSDYRFPSTGTVAFEPDDVVGDTVVHHVRRLSTDQVLGNDEARWPCFFPSSAGMLTTWRQDGSPTAMPCGSTAIVGRWPFTIAACISNCAINERYAPRATLSSIRSAGRFGVGVPFANASIEQAIAYLGNISAREDPDKVRHAGLTVLRGHGSPVLAALPVHLECRVMGEQDLGTHILVLGEVVRVHARRDLTPENPLLWQPWATVT